MELVNTIYHMRSDDRHGPEALPVLRLAVETALLLISPMVPHIADEMWDILGHQKSVAREPWPQWDEEAVVEEKQLIVVQVNGKLRNRIYVSPSAANEEIQQTALADERVKMFIGDKPVRKVVVVPGRLVNVVV
jgi:leucyl-tRNA synthetase